MFLPDRATRAVGSRAWERALPATHFLLGTQWGHHCPSPPSGNPSPSGPEPRPSRPHLTSLCSLPRGRGLAHSGVWDPFVKHVCAGTRTRMLEGPDSPLQAVSTMPAGVRRDPVHRAPKGPPAAGHLTLCSGTDRPRPRPHHDFPGLKHFRFHGFFLRKY